MAHMYLSLVSLPLSWATKPGIVLSNWSTDTHSPGWVDEWILPLFAAPLVRQFFFVMAPYMHDAHLGGWTSLR